VSCETSTKRFATALGARLAESLGLSPAQACNAVLEVLDLATTRASQRPQPKDADMGAAARVARMRLGAEDALATAATAEVFAQMQAMNPPILPPAHGDVDPNTGFALPKMEARHGWRAVAELAEAVAQGQPLPSLAAEVRAAMRARPAVGSELANLRAAVGPLADHTRQYLEDDVAAALREGNTDLAGVVATFERLAGPPKGPLTAAQAGIAGAILAHARDGVPLTDDHLRALWRAYDSMRDPTVDLADTCHTLDIAVDNEPQLQPVAATLWALQRWAVHNIPVAGFRYKSDVAPFLRAQGVATPVTVSSDRNGLIVRLKGRRGALPITITIEPNGRRMFAPADVSAALLALELQKIEDLLEGSEARLEI